ncbi:MAG TPA: ribosomal RNA adenine dimethylase domain-containing protein [Vicinamibacteria bacterium]|jgi:phospholipid N-methyltransferase
MADQAVQFLKEFVNRPQEIGAIVPSSPALAREVVRSIAWDKVQVAVEYGPGLGAITGEILTRTEGKDFFAIELNQAYADRFRRSYPDVPLYRDSVANVVSIAAEHGVEAIDCVISGLPWAIFSDAVQDEILDAMFQVLREGGQFVTFAYMHGLALPAGRRFREKLTRRFRKLDRSPVVWRNTPPAVVYHCVR